MRIENSIWLHHLIWAVPLLLIVAWWNHRARRKRLTRLIAPALWPAIVPFYRANGPVWRTGFRILCLVFIVLALARPQWGSEWQELRRKGLDLMVVLDVSRSMLAEDIRPNRLERSKLGILDLIEQLQGDRVGLILFAGAARAYCPLTIDYPAFRFCLEDARPELVPTGGTDLNAAIETVIKAFEKSERSSDKAVLLVSDGEDHDQNIDESIRRLREREIRVFTVGVGSPEGELIPLRNEQGGQDFLKNRENQVVKSRLNEAVLLRLATETGGAYVRAGRLDFGAERLYEEFILKLERDELETRRVQRMREQHAWFSAFALLALIVESLFATNHARRERMASS
jgi:Ca-activated chloride channel homolog